MSETTRIADLLMRVFDGEAWHGPSVLPLIQDLDARRAARRPIQDGHSIWEIVKHIAVWDHAVCRRLAGQKVQPTAAEDFPAVTDESEAAWRDTVQELVRAHRELIAAVETFPDEKLNGKVPGKEPDYHTFYFNLHGVIQHEVYHAGQIALLKKLV